MLRLVRTQRGGIAMYGTVARTRVKPENREKLQEELAARHGARPAARRGGRGGAPCTRRGHYTPRGKTRRRGKRKRRDGREDRGEAEKPGEGEGRARRTRCGRGPQRKKKPSKPQ